MTKYKIDLHTAYKLIECEISRGLNLSFSLFYPKTLVSWVPSKNAWFINICIDERKKTDSFEIPIKDLTHYKRLMKFVDKIVKHYRN